MTATGSELTYTHPLKAVRCTGTVRNGERAGEQCRRSAILGHRVCSKHGGQLPGVQRVAAQVVEDARMRIALELVDEAVETLQDVMKPGVSDAVRLKAATEILDRVGIRGGTELTVSAGENLDPSAQLRDKLAKLRETINVIEGEVLPPGGDTIAPEAQDHSEELADARGLEDGADRRDRT